MLFIQMLVVYLYNKIKQIEIMRTEKIYRAAQKGLEVMNSGSFYTFDKDLAEEYICDGDELYTFDVNINLFNVTDFMSINDFDYGLAEIFERLEDEGISKESVFYQNDGVCINCGTTQLIVLFGQVSVLTNEIKKLSFDDAILEDELFEIIK